MVIFTTTMSSSFVPVTTIINDIDRMELPPFGKLSNVPLLKLAPLYDNLSCTRTGGSTGRQSPSLPPPTTTTTDFYSPSSIVTATTSSTVTPVVPSSAPWDVWIPRNMDGSKLSSTYAWYISLFLSTVNELSTALLLPSSSLSVTNEDNVSIPLSDSNPTVENTHSLFLSLPIFPIDCSSTSSSSGTAVSLPPSLPTSFDQLYFLHRDTREQTYTLPETIYGYYHQIYSWLQHFQTLVEQEGIDNPTKGLSLLGIIPLSPTLLRLQTVLETRKSTISPPGCRLLSSITPSTEDIDGTSLHHVTLALKYCLMITYHTASTEQIMRWYMEGIIAYNYSLILWLCNWLENYAALPLATYNQILECFLYCLSIEDKFYRSSNETTNDTVSNPTTAASSSSLSSSSILPYLFREQIISPSFVYQLCVHSMDKAFFPYDPSMYETISAVENRLSNIGKGNIHYRSIYNALQLLERYLQYALTQHKSSTEWVGDVETDILRYYYNHHSSVTTMINSSISSVSSSNLPIDVTGTTETIPGPELRSLFYQLIYFLLLVTGTVTDKEDNDKNGGQPSDQEFLDQCIKEYFQLSLPLSNEYTLSLPQRSIQYISVLYNAVYLRYHMSTTVPNIFFPAMEPSTYINLLYTFLSGSTVTNSNDALLKENSSSLSSLSLPNISSFSPSFLLSSSLIYTRQVWGTRLISVLNNLCALPTSPTKKNPSSPELSSFYCLFFLNHILRSPVSVSDSSSSGTSIDSRIITTSSSPSSTSTSFSPPTLATTTDHSATVYRFFHSLFYMNDRTVLVDILTKQLYNTSSEEDLTLRILDICVLQNIHQCTLNEGYPAVYKKKINDTVETLLRTSTTTMMRIPKDRKHTDQFLVSLYQQCLVDIQQALTTPELEY